MHTPAGFTLLELVLSLAVASILFTALGSAVMLATKALPTDDAPGTQRHAAARFARTLDADLQLTTAVLGATATKLTLVTADQTGDGRPDLVVYAWSGAGLPVTRSVNRETPEPLLDAADALAYTPTWTTRTSSYPGPPQEQHDVLLSETLVTSDGKDFDVKKDNWLAEVITVDWPAGAIGVELTHAQFAIEPHGGETNWFRLYASDGTTATGSAVSSMSYSKDDNDPNDEPYDDLSGPKSNFRWARFDFTPYPIADAGAVALAVEGNPGDGGTHSHYRYENSVDLGTIDSNGNGTWSDTGTAMIHRLYGTVLTPGTTQQLTREHLDRVAIALTLNGQTYSYTVKPALGPEHIDRWWLADFDVAPTGTRLHDPGVDDWTTNGYDVFNHSLTNGAWDVNDTLIASIDPDDGDTPITINWRARATSTTGSGVFLLADFDRQGNGHVATVRVRLESDGSNQTLRVDRYDAGVATTVFTRGSLPDEFIDVRLLCEPARNHVAVWANHTHVGTFSYTPDTPGGAPPGVRCATNSTSGLIDELLVRVGAP